MYTQIMSQTTKIFLHIFSNWRFPTKKELIVFMSYASVIFNRDFFQISLDAVFNCNRHISAIKQTFVP